MIPVSPEMLAFAIRSAIRLGAAGRDAYEQHVRDRDFELPFSPAIEADPIARATAYFTRTQEAETQFLQSSLAVHWDVSGSRPKPEPEHQNALIEAWTAARALESNQQESWRAIRMSEEQEAGLVLRQWNDEDGPPPPLLRVGLAIAEVGLDFVGTNPGLFGVGGNGERMIAALAANLSELLPDPDNPNHWPKVHFLERTAAIVMHAGLKTLSENPDFVADEKHLQDLVRNVTKPLVDQFDEDPAQVPSLIVLRDTLFGPVATAAFETLVEHQTAFLGERFAADKALGAVTNAVLREASQTGGLQEIATTGGLVRIYKAALGVAVERPELFITGSGDEEQLARELLSGVAGSLRGAEGLFSKETLGEIAAVAIDAGGRYAGKRIGTDTPWQKVAVSSLDHFLKGVQDGIAAGGQPEDFARLFSRGQAVELARIVLEQAASTPGMLVGDDAGAEVEAIVSAVTRAMAADADLLLTPEDWLEIVAVAAEEAARNPGRLFRLDAADPSQQLASQVISGLLRAAGEDFRARGRAGGSVLFGETLRTAITTTLEAAGGNAGKFSERLGGVVALAKQINDLVGSDPQRYGANEWMHLYRELVTEVAESLDVATLTPEQLAARLAK